METKRKPNVRLKDPMTLAEKGQMIDIEKKLVNLKVKECEIFKDEGRSFRNRVTSLAFRKKESLGIEFASHSKNGKFIVIRIA